MCEVLPDGIILNAAKRKSMFKYRFLRNSFLVSLLVSVTLPIYSVFITIPHFSALLTANTEADAIRVANHVMGDMRENQMTLSHPMVISDAFEKKLQVLVADFNVMKYRIFSAEGKIVISSVEEEIGQFNTNTYFHEIVANGEIFTKTVSKEHRTMEGEALKMDVVESYVPIMEDGHFLGAIEIYYDITERKRRMDEEVLHSSVMLIGISVGLLLLVFFIRRSIIHPIAKVTGAMMRLAEGDLEQKVPVIGQDELSDMARIFNQMCDDLRLTRHGLENEKNKLTTILLGAREGIVATDEEGKVVLVNPATQRLLGKTEQQIVDEGFFHLFDDPDFLRSFLKNSGVGMPGTLVYNQHVLSVYASTIVDSGSRVIGSAALIRDVTEEKKLEQQLRDLSYTDGLTGLINRRRMDSLLKEEFLRARRYHLEFGVLLFDVDHFKRFNDTHGHDQGDRVLQSLADAMKAFFRNVDYCCRYGGEEFCVIMPNTVSPGIADAAERFRQTVEEMTVDGLHVTISIGIGIYPSQEEVESPEAIIKLADRALYEAKEQGRNRVCSAR